MNDRCPMCGSPVFAFASGNVYQDAATGEDYTTVEMMCACGHREIIEIYYWDEEDESFSRKLYNADDRARECAEQEAAGQLKLLEVT